MDSNYWHKKWQANDIRFHQRNYHHMLVKNKEKFPQGKILIPLCGKTLDILYFSENGYEVIGVELSAIACEAFFTENKIAYQVNVQNNFTVFSSSTISLWCGDFFSLPPEAWNGVCTIYDRAALIALPKELRNKYAQAIIARAKICHSFAMLLITLEYAQETVTGPPFSVPVSEVHALYDSLFNVNETQSEKNGEFAQNHPKFQSADVFEKAYWACKKVDS